ncbi:hypothetical protein EPI10_032017 [Gossypium australe]|uniref:Uncharacterized protein n=1 Tax=Gossypium australe TaxID=47621 RepID=A0A5B6X5R7_9ROSI|nr:hypothetical protein EPI10_032017 [Gossypium australe]
MATKSYMRPNERFTYSLKPPIANVVHKVDKHQQILDKLNRLETTSTRPGVHKPTRTSSQYFESQSGEVNYVGNRGGNPYSNTYNLGWKDHPSLRWGGNQGGGNSSQNRQNPIYQSPYMQSTQERAIRADYVVRGQRLEQIEGEMQPICVAGVPCCNTK